MYLTQEEEEIYEGEKGWAKQVCMKILVRLGELYNATKLIPIQSAHVSGVSYKTLGDGPIEFLRAMADSKEKVQVKTTLNPQSFDPEYFTEILPEDIQKKQMEILEQYREMGFTMSLTCTPYYLEQPKAGSHLAWSESSAVVYANSVLGALTNREGGPSALASAVIGKTPNYGIHQRENRKPNVLVEVEAPLQNKSEFGALGIHLGQILEDKTPLIQGIEHASEEELKQLGASLATTGMADMFHRDPEKKRRGMDKITVGKKELKKTVENLSTPLQTKPDLVFTGCPHCSLKEIREIATLMGNKKINSETEFWVCTSQQVKEKAGRYINKIEKCGGKVLTDMCTVVSWTEKLGIDSIMTDSAKTAYYVPTLSKAKPKFASLKKCLKTLLREGAPATS